MSYEIEVLKVLASHPNGRAAVADIKRDLATLASPEWGNRVRALARNAQYINVFSSGYIIRHPDAWEITDAGLKFLRHLEMGTLDQLASGATEGYNVGALPDRPQRPFQQHRPDLSSDRRNLMRRMRKLAANWLRRKSG